VRSFGLAPELVLSRLARSTYVVKDRIAGPPERGDRSSADDVLRLAALGGQECPPHMVHPTVLETLQTYRAAKNPVNRGSHRISTGFPHWDRGAMRHPALGFRRPDARSFARDGMAFRFWALTQLDFGAVLTRKSGRLEIEKRTYVWRFLALKVPFGNLLLPCS
jgi:hypothetical protein